MAAQVFEGAQAISMEGKKHAKRKVKWLKHYSSAQSILIVGDGDFSFALALATAFGSGENLVATSLDSYGKSILPANLSLCSFSFLNHVASRVYFR
jgi:25S rRNA (uracil2634-N3)-methyltransferase